jgi:nitrous oxide reductase accessory protein NosL
MLSKIVISSIILIGLTTGCSGKDEQITKPTMKQARSAKHMMMFQSVPMDKATILQKGDSKLYCTICGMTLPMFYKTNHAADVDSEVHQYCSIHCVVDEKDIQGKNVKNIKVVDTNSLKFIDASSAYYVVGSNKKGTMSMVSKYAFASKDDANSFIKENGGKLATFEEAYNISKKDFSPKMFEKMKAKKMMMAKKGEQVYKMKCKQTNLPKFNSIADAKTYITKNNICPDLKGKPLQAIGIYLFKK